MKFLIKIKQNIFFKNIILLTSGSILAQFVVVLCAPIITRVYEVDEIGVYSYIIAMVSIFTAVLNLRYDMAIVVEKDEKNIYSIIKLSIIIGIIFSSIATVIFGIYFIIFKVEYKNYRYILLFYFILLVTNSLINVFNSYNNRYKEYKTMTMVYIIRTICQNVGGILFGIFNFGMIGLLLSYTLGQFLGMKKQSSTLRTKLKDIWESSYQEMKRVAKIHKFFPLYSSPAMIANSFSYSSITIFMELLFDMKVVGYYSLSTRILGLPLSLISGNVSKVFFQEASVEKSKRGNFCGSYRKTISLLLVIAIPMGFVMYYFSPWLCGIFFGKSWIVAGEYIKILTPYYVFRFIGTTISPGLIVSKKQSQELIIQILLVITSIFSFAVTLFTNMTVKNFLISISITKSIVYIILIFLVWKNSKKNIEL